MEREKMSQLLTADLIKNVFKNLRQRLEKEHVQALMQCGPDEIEKQRRIKCMQFLIFGLFEESIYRNMTYINTADDLRNHLLNQRTAISSFIEGNLDKIFDDEQTGDF